MGNLGVWQFWYARSSTSHIIINIVFGLNSIAIETIFGHKGLIG